MNSNPPDKSRRVSEHPDCAYVRPLPKSTWIIRVTVLCPGLSEVKEGNPVNTKEWRGGMTVLCEVHHSKMAALQPRHCLGGETSKEPSAAMRKFVAA